jgi:Fic family protein
MNGERKPVEIPGTPYSYEAIQDKDILAIAGRVRTLREGGTLSPKVLGNIRKYFRIKNIYHSNAIEGNELTVGETREVVERGLTITGKSLKDQAEAKNLSQALDFLEELATKTEDPITESDIRQLHQVVLKDINDDNAGKYRSVQVEISGSEYKPPPPEQIPMQMEEFGKWLAEASLVKGEIGSNAALLIAASAHTWFVYIHPFIDGNGRVARLLMNLILMRYGYPIAIITKEDRLRYYDALEISQVSDLSPFLALLTECLYESLEEYETAAQQQREQIEWAESLARKFSANDLARAQNEYEVWKSAMELLKSYFRQTAEILSQTAALGRVYFKDFGTLEFEKYLSLRDGQSTKKTWFFRVDFRSESKAARYLFFFGSPSYVLQSECDVTLHIAREEPAGSFNYERLSTLSMPNVPHIFEIGYRPKEEVFVTGIVGGKASKGKIENITQNLFEEIVQKHFQS